MTGRRLVLIVISCFCFPLVVFNRGASSRGEGLARARRRLRGQCRRLHSRNRSKNRLMAFRLTLLLVILGLPSCKAREGEVVPDHRAEDRAASERRERLWERRRQCASAAATMMARPEWAKPVGAVMTVGWENHYNESMDRCFVRVSTSDREANGKNGIPPLTYSVIDVFDASGPNVSCTDDTRAMAIFCASTDEKGMSASGDCGKCRALAKDLMTK